MTDAVTEDLARYLRCQDEAEAEQEFIDDAADQLASDWYIEYCIFGRIDALDWDAADIKFLMAGHSTDALSVIRAEAYKWVADDPDQFKDEPDYSEMTR